MEMLDLSKVALRDVNQLLHSLPQDTNRTLWRLANAHGEHACAVGLTQPIEVNIEGHIGYYCGGMNKVAKIVINGQCGVGVGENMMSGEIWVNGNASAAAGATGRGGLLVITGDAGTRCGISMKGIDIVVGGSIGAMSAFMAQRGRLVVCGNAGPSLGDSIYEAKLYIQGKTEGLGADCVEEAMNAQDIRELAVLLERAKMKADASKFRKYGSARKLYHFNVDHADAY